MIRLKRLVVQNFRSFVDRTTIEFPASGLVLIRGQNSTNHDSSGSGKSSLLLAIAYALDMCPFAASDLTSWNGTGAMQVELELELRGQTVTICRGKKNSFEAADGGKVTGAKAVAEAVRKLFGLDPETLQAITYRPQNTPGLFLALTDGEKKEFLTRLLGLGKIEKAVDETDARIKAIEYQINVQFQPVLHSLEQELARAREYQVPERKDTTQLVISKEAAQKRHSEIDGEIQQIRAEEAQAKAVADQDPALLQLQQYRKVANTQLQAVLATNQARQQEFLAKQEKLRRRLEEIARRDQLKLNLFEQIRQLTSQIGVAEQSKCPKCERPWDAAAEEASKLRATVDNLQGQISFLGSTGDRPQVEAGLREQFVSDPMIEQFQQLIKRLDGQVAARREEVLSSPSRVAREKILELTTEKQVLATNFGNLAQQIQMADSFNSQIEKLASDKAYRISSVEATIAAHKAEVEGKLRELNAEKDFSLLMGREGFLGVIFDEVLREIESEANERLGRLANVSHVTISFKTEVETQKGTLQRKIVPMVYVGGVETKLKTGLSGGMYTSVEQVVDLAVMSVVQRRTGALPGFLFLDEAFNGQGTATKEAAMEVLKEYAQDKLVLVIDHNSEFKEMFTQFIDVSFADGKSTVS